MIPKDGALPSRSMLSWLGSKSGRNFHVWTRIRHRSKFLNVVCYLIVMFLPVSCATWISLIKRSMRFISSATVIWLPWTRFPRLQESYMCSAIPTLVLGGSKREPGKERVLFPLTICRGCTKSMNNGWTLRFVLSAKKLKVVIILPSKNWRAKTQKKINSISISLRTFSGRVFNRMTTLFPNNKKNKNKSNKLNQIIWQFVHLRTPKTCWHFLQIKKKFWLLTIRFLSTKLALSDRFRTGCRQDSDSGLIGKIIMWFILSVNFYEF